MSAELKGTFIQKLPEVTGQGRTGNTWRKQEFVIETLDSQYPKKACFSLWGNNVDLLAPMQLGEVLNVSFDVESREYNGRWYTDLRAWRVTKEPAATAAAPMPATPAAPAAEPVAAAATYVQPTDLNSTSSAEDLPF